jgi:hypothetical protein
LHVRKKLAIGTLALVAIPAIVAGLAGQARAADTGPAAAPAPTLAPDANVEFSESAPEGKTTDEATAKVDFNAPPPSRPRKKGFVLESAIGALGFLGRFQHVSPAAPLLRTQLGYEFFSWLMLFVSGELAYTDTSEAADPSHVRAFPIYGIGGGLRGTIHATERFAFTISGDVGGMASDLPKGSLGQYGFGQAEGFNPYFGGHLGVEWYQVDRHLAVAAQGGLRDATGFARAQLAGAGGDTPLLWDGGLALRYTF